MVFTFTVIFGSDHRRFLVRAESKISAFTTLLGFLNYNSYLVRNISNIEVVVLKDDPDIVEIVF